MNLPRSFFIFAVGLGVFCAGFATPGQQGARSKSKPVTINVAEIDFDGLKRVIQRDPAKGRPLLVNFWATWCDPCREEFPDLVKVDSDYRRKGLELAAISLDDAVELKTGVPAFLREMHSSMPAYLLNVNDPAPAIAYVDEKWTGALPATFLFDANGKVVYKRFGRIDPSALRAAIDQVVKR